MSIEVQHLLTLVERTQFDTIYHEHFQYYTVLTAQRALASGGLALVDVELLDTHGGSLRLWARPADSRRSEPSQAVRDVLAARGGGRAAHGRGARRVRRGGVPGARRPGRASCIDAPRAGKTVVGYGAPGKGNTLLNYCGIRPDLLAYTVDRNPYKHGRFTPGTRIPILRARADRRRPARLRAGAALEPAHRADRATVLRRGSGAAAWSSRIPTLEVV